MKSAYNETSIYNLAVIKETKRWYKHHFIDQQQFNTIAEAYKTPLYHPNFIIRILLFVATLFALAGVSGLFFLFFGSSNEHGILTASIFYGIISFIFLELVFLKNNHYKSGVTEALLYHAIGFTIVGISGLFDFDNFHVTLFCCLLIFSFSAFRYLDLLCTIAAILSFAGVLFFEFYSVGGIFQQIIPFIFMIAFTITYIVSKKLKASPTLRIWRNNLLMIEAASLLFIYIGGNYLVVRELSVNLMDLSLEPGDNIPFAFIFYGFTIFIPLVFLYWGIRSKDIVILRVSLFVIAFTVFTFKYYYSLGHPEVSLTGAGIILIALSIALFNYLKIIRGGFTRENLLSEKWGNVNVEAFIISQTMGGNQANTVTEDTGGGGGFGGGGASTDF